MERIVEAAQEATMTQEEWRHAHLKISSAAERERLRQRYFRLEARRMYLAGEVQVSARGILTDAPQSSTPPALAGKPSPSTQLLDSGRRGAASRARVIPERLGRVQVLQQAPLCEAPRLPRRVPVPRRASKRLRNGSRNDGVVGGGWKGRKTARGGGPPPRMGRRRS